MIYFVNPATKRRKKATAGRKRKKKASPAQMRARRKFAAMAKARAKASKSRKRASTRRKPVMARKRRAVASKKRRRTVRRKSGAGVRLVRRGTTVYQGNPKRRRVRRYGRNPGLLAQVKQTAKDTAFVLVGGAAGRTISNVIPFGGSPLLEFAKGTVAALAVRMAASKFLGGDAARFAAAGAMQVPLKALVTGFVPGAAGFLGESDYELAAYSNVAGYIDGTGSTDMGMDEDAALASYSDNY